MERDAHCEAQEEARAIVLLDACAGVHYQEHPARIAFDWLKERQDHYPDILVVCETLKEFWECKRDEEARDLVVRKRTERLTELLAPIGFGYRLLTTSALGSKNYYTNATLLRRAAKALVEHPEWAAAAASLGEEPIAVAEALATISPELRETAFHSLLFHGYLRARMDAPLCLDTRVSHKDGSSEPPWVWQLFARSN